MQNKVNQHPSCTFFFHPIYRPCTTLALPPSSNSDSGSHSTAVTKKRFRFVLPESHNEIIIIKIHGENPESVSKWTHATIRFAIIFMRLLIWVLLYLMLYFISVPEDRFGGNRLATRWTTLWFRYPIKTIASYTTNKFLRFLVSPFGPRVQQPEKTKIVILSGLCQ